MTIFLFLCIVIILYLNSNILKDIKFKGFKSSLKCEKICLEVKAMTNEELKQAIEQVCNNVFPRNIVAICSKLGITVQETNQFDNNISGLIYKENDKYFILVNAKHAPTRKAFTIAHELAHYILHRTKLDNESEIVSFLKSKDTDYPALARSSSLNDCDYNKMETQANQLAADILMPEKEFIAKCEELNSIEDVAQYFGVSVAAASVRASKCGGWFFL